MSSISKYAYPEDYCESLFEFNGGGTLATEDYISESSKFTAKIFNVTINLKKD